MVLLPHRRNPSAAPRWRGGLLAPLARHPSLFWAVAALLAVATGWLVSDVTAEARRTIDGWGERRVVLVATAPIGAGEPLASATAPVEVPAALAPSSGVTEPADRVAATAIHPGEIVVAERVAEPGTVGRAATLPAGTAGITVPVGAATPPLGPGDHVDLWASTDPLLSPDGPAAMRVVARRASVVDTGEGWVLLAVHEADLAATTTALVSGLVSLALVP